VNVKQEKTIFLGAIQGLSAFARLKRKTGWQGFRFPHRRKALSIAPFGSFLCAFLSLCVTAELFDGQASCYKKFCCPIPSGKCG
jgi:hypothetical protein